jgi:glutamate-1-semialdehyde 2,1-aminomutase
VVAEKLNEHVPCAEKVKFCVTGSEAVQMAVRLARAYTKRPYFIRFGRHYHGWMDNVLGGVVDQTPQGKPFAAEDPGSDTRYTRGRAPGANEESLLLPWNDEKALERTLERYGEEVALIHFEALVCNRFCMMPKPGFLEKTRDLCDRYGIVMSIDEVITGFRLGLGGAQDHFGITPDLATFGKAMAGGAPMSAVVGKAAIMDQLRTNDVLGPGTFNGYPFGMRAVLATLKILEKNDGEAYATMERVQKRLTDGLQELTDKRGIPMAIQGARGVFFTLFGLEPGTVVYSERDVEELDSGIVASFWGAMQEEGIVLIPDGRWYPSIAHTDEDVDRTLEIADKVFGRIK